MMFILTYFNAGQCFYLYPQNFQNFIYNIYDKL